jgi:hypothetical protein
MKKIVEKYVLLLADNYLLFLILFFVSLFIFAGCDGTSKQGIDDLLPWRYVSKDINEPEYTVCYKLDESTELVCVDVYEYIIMGRENGTIQIEYKDKITGKIIFMHISCPFYVIKKE